MPATDDNARGRGVMVVLNDEIHSARNVIKTNTTSLQTFESPMRGPLGFVHTGKIDWFQQVTPHDFRDYDFQVAPIVRSQMINGTQTETVYDSV